MPQNNQTADSAAAEQKFREKLERATETELKAWFEKELKEHSVMLQKQIKDRNFALKAQEIGADAQRGDYAAQVAWHGKPGEKGEAGQQGFIGHAKSQTAESVKGFESFLAMIMSIFALYKDLNRAMFLSHPAKSALDNTVAFISQLLANRDNENQKSTLKADAALPAVMHTIDLDENDALSPQALTKCLARSDGKEFTPEQKIMLEVLLKKVITTWLISKGYDEDSKQEGKFFRHGNPTEPLNREAFQQLRDAKDSGFMDSASQDSNVKFEPSFRP